ncbi:MAG: DUF5668 domain-containing protein [Acidobacteriota bacterium]
MSKKNSETIFWGIIIILIGIIFLAKNLGWTDLHIWDIVGKYWPLILIYIGAKNIISFISNKK